MVGGGAAGLSGALTLARARKSVLVIDAGEQRNRPASGVHEFLTRDGLAPAELVALGRASGATAARCSTAASPRSAGARGR